MMAFEFRWNRHEWIEFVTGFGRILAGFRNAGCGCQITGCFPAMPEGEPGHAMEDTDWEASPISNVKKRTYHAPT